MRVDNNYQRRGSQDLTSDRGNASTGRGSIDYIEVVASMRIVNPPYQGRHIAQDRDIVAEQLYLLKLSLNARNR